MTATMLRAVQRLLTGDVGRLSVGFADVTPREWVSVGLLLAPAVWWGLAPRPLLDVLEPAASVVADLVAR